MLTRRQTLGLWAALAAAAALVSGVTRPMQKYVQDPAIKSLDAFLKAHPNKHVVAYDSGASFGLDDIYAEPAFWKVLKKNGFTGHFINHNWREQNRVEEASETNEPISGVSYELQQSLVL